MAKRRGVSWGGRRAAAATLAIAGTVAASSGFQAQAAESGPMQDVIVRTTGDVGAGEELVERLGGQVDARIGIIDGFTARVPASAVAELGAAPGIVSVTPDAKVRVLASGDAAALTAAASHPAEAIGATQLWQSGATGAGVGVALIDTGVVPTGGLEDNLVNALDISFESVVPELQYLDTYGHGTHMAGIIAGDVPAADGRRGFTGVAPDATVVNVKVAQDDGATDVSQVIAAIDWVVTNPVQGGVPIRVLNLSFGTDSLQSYMVDPLAYAAEVAWRKGIVVVVAAGNEGEASSRITNPAIDPYVLAVGAADTNGTVALGDDSVAAFSSRGNGSRRADVIAPGRSILSLRNAGSTIDYENPQAVVDDIYFKGSGTSQAAAVTSGAVALLLQQRPELTPDQVKALLRSTADDIPGTDPGEGAGTIDIAAAAAAAVPAGHVQSHPTSMGTGKLEGARGSVQVEIDGNVLQGEIDIFGAQWNGTRWSKAMWNGSSWYGDVWNGTRWSGGAWESLSWAGTRWSGTRWSGTRWSGTRWSGDGWSGTRWSGTRWSGTRWSGTRWSGTRWSGTRWSGTRWSSAAWGD